jgi:putative membrane protein
MKRAPLLLISTALLTLVACGQKREPVPESVANNSAVAPTPAPVSANKGQLFVNTAAASDTFEIEASKLAESNGASASVRKFAASMIKGHTDSTAKLKAAAASSSPPLTPDPTLSPAQQQTLDSLKAQKGVAFDSAYAEAQVNAHAEALGILRAYASDGDVPALKSFAASLVPIVTGHLNMAKGLKS